MKTLGPMIGTLWLSAVMLAPAFARAQAVKEDPVLYRERNINCAEWARIANHYISLGEEKAAEELLDRTSKHPKHFAISNDHACHICRMLYVAKPGKTLRRPLLGAWTLPDGSISDDRWPDFPFAVQDGVWFRLVDVYWGTGAPEPIQNYIAYCQANGVFRSKPLDIPNSKTAKQALETLLKSPSWYGRAWKKDESKVRILARQAAY